MKARGPGKPRLSGENASNLGFAIITFYFENRIEIAFTKITKKHKKGLKRLKKLQRSKKNNEKNIKDLKKKYNK